MDTRAMLTNMLMLIIMQAWRPTYAKRAGLCMCRKSRCIQDISLICHITYYPTCIMFSVQNETFLCALSFPRKSYFSLLLTALSWTLTCQLRPVGSELWPLLGRPLLTGSQYCMNTRDRSSSAICPNTCFYRLCCWSVLTRLIPMEAGRPYSHLISTTTEQESWSWLSNLKISNSHLQRRTNKNRRQNMTRSLMETQSVFNSSRLNTQQTTTSDWTCCWHCLLPAGTLVTLRLLHFLQTLKAVLYNKRSAIITLHLLPLSPIDDFHLQTRAAGVTVTAWETQTLNAVVFSRTTKQAGKAVRGFYLFY